MVGSWVVLGMHWSGSQHPFPVRGGVGGIGGKGARVVPRDTARLHRGALEDGGSRRGHKRDGKSDEFELHTCFGLYLVTSLLADGFVSRSLRLHPG
jgi:hypothetical protein